LLSDLTPGDFQFYKRYADDMKQCHEKEFVSTIKPDLLRAMYRGRVKTDSYGTKYNVIEDDERDLMAFSRLFQATNTILPNLYYQNPSPIIIPQRGSDNNSAALMSAILKHYMKLNRAKEQNQEAVLNAWFFGIGYKKLGYRTVFLPKVDEPESQMDASVMDKLKSAASSIFGRPDNAESKERPELVDYETLFNDSENPMNVMLDHKADRMNGKARLHRLPRTLYDLQNYGDYEENLEEVESRLRDKFGSRFDSRETTLHLNELQIMQRNGIWILTWLDEYEKPLRYEKSTYQGKNFLWSDLVFTNEPGIRYPISHMKVASQVQSKLDKLANMYVELIGRSAHLIAVCEKNLAPGQADALEKNLLRGILKFKNPISQGDLMNFQSAQVPADMDRLMGMLQQNVTEIMGADEQSVAGSSGNKTLGQDELARMGSRIRESGMQDRVRDFMIDQFRKEGTLIKQYSNAELHLVITGHDYSDAMSGERVEDKWVDFMTETNPLGAKHSLQGEFDYEVNVEDAVKPNKQALQQQYEKLMTVIAQPGINEALLQDNSRPRVGLVYKRWLETFDGIGNPDMYIEKLDSMQVAAIQAQKMLMSGAMGTGASSASKPKGDPSPAKPTAPISDNGVSNQSSVNQ
jgi:hypothetical protein